MPDEPTFTDLLGNTHDRWPQRHLPARRDLPQGLARHPKLVYAVSSGRCSTPTRTPSSATWAISSAGSSAFTRPQRHPGHPLAAGLSPLLAGPRSRDGRRVLPSVLRLRRLGAGRRCPALVQRDAGQQPEHPRRQARPARSDLRHQRVDVVDADDKASSAPVAATATGNSTRKSPRGSASRPTQPRGALHRRRHRATGNPRSGWPTASTSSTRGAGARRHGGPGDYRSSRSMPA